MSPSKPPEVKICGLCDGAGRDAALKGGARWLGFVLAPGSPRTVDRDTAATLAAQVPREKVVAVTVNARDDELDSVMATLNPGVIQLHGGEDADRVADVRRRYGVEVWRAVRVRSRSDLAGVESFAGVADRILLDSGAGTGKAFDWSWLQGFCPSAPWLLAGGLTPDNLARALRSTRAPAVDVSSGVESARGRKDPARIASFFQAAHAFVLLDDGVTAR